MSFATIGVIASSLIASSASLILDTYPTAMAVYSLRRMRTAYSGDCVRVRRSSDNVEQNFGFVNNGLDTVALLAFVGANNGFVVTWFDQSGNGHNATQPTASVQPRIVNAGVLDIKNTKPTIYWSGTRVLQTGSVINHSALLTASVVVSTESTIFNGGLFQIGAINGHGSILESNKWEGRANNGNFSAQVSRLVSTLQVVTARLENNLQRIERDGVTGNLDGSDTLSNAVSRVLTVGGLDLNTGLNTVGEISELVLFTSILGNTERLAFQNDQKAFYATP